MYLDLKLVIRLEMACNALLRMHDLELEIWMLKNGFTFPQEIYWLKNN